MRAELLEPVRPVSRSPSSAGASPPRAASTAAPRRSSPPTAACSRAPRRSGSSCAADPEVGLAALASPIRAGIGSLNACAQDGRKEEGAHMTGRRTAGVIAVGALLALPGVAEAKTKTVNMGIPPASGKAFQKARRRRQRLLPARRDDQQGRQDQVPRRRLPLVRLPAARRRDAPADLADGRRRSSGSNDAAGQPFWFNGQDQVGFTPVARSSRHVRQEALVQRQQADRQRPAAGRQAQADHRDLQEVRQVHLLLQHPRRHEGHGHRQGQGQVGAVRQGGQEGPASTRSRRRSATAKKLPKTQVPANTIDVGAAGKHGEELFAFVPSAVTVPSRARR